MPFVTNFAKENSLATSESLKRWFDIHLLHIGSEQEVSPVFPAYFALKIYLTGDWVFELFVMISDVSYPAYWLPGESAPWSVWSSREPELDWRGGGERAAHEDQRFPVRYSQVAPPSSSFTIFLITTNWTLDWSPEKLLNFKSFSFISKENSMQMQKSLTWFLTSLTKERKYLKSFVFKN